jgi:hypothetical protein
MVMNLSFVFSVMSGGRPSPGQLVVVRIDIERHTTSALWETSPRDSPSVLPSRTCLTPAIAQSTSPFRPLGPEALLYTRRSRKYFPSSREKTSTPFDSGQVDDGAGGQLREVRRSALRWVLVEVDIFMRSDGGWDYV